MGNFSTKIKNRAWIGTVQTANMEKTGLSEEEYKDPEKLAEFLCTAWEKSGKGRTASAAVCISEKGLYHAHIALYGNLTTLGNAARIMFDSHIEPQRGGKKALTGYLLKEPPYDEKGEHVLCVKGLENIQDCGGKRSDLEDIEEMLSQGLTPGQIMEHFPYRKFEKMIKSAFIDKRMKETPLLKEDLKCTWIVGESGSGKTYRYYQLCKEYGEENVYLANDFQNGGMDFYIEQGAPPILFLDEFKGEIPFSQLLVMLDKYSRSQMHCRYTNCYCLWEMVVITSVYPPDEVYTSMVDTERQERDKFEQLLRRLDTIEYRYKQDGEYKTFSIPGSRYENYESLKQMALGDKNGFVKLDEGMPPSPFEDGGTPPVSAGNDTAAPGSYESGVQMSIYDYEGVVPDEQDSSNMGKIEPDA